MPVFVDGKRVASQSAPARRSATYCLGSSCRAYCRNVADVGGAVADGPVEARVQVGRDRAETGGRKAPDDVAYRRIDAPYVHDDDDRRRCGAGLFRPSGIRRHGRAVDVEDGAVDSDARVALGNERRVGLPHRRRRLRESAGHAADARGGGRGDTDERPPADVERGRAGRIYVETVHEGAV